MTNTILNPGHFENNNSFTLFTLKSLILMYSMDENQNNEEQNQQKPEKEPETNFQEPIIVPIVHKYRLPIEPKINPTLAAVIGLIGGFILYQLFGSLLLILVLGFDFQNAPPNSLRLIQMAGQLLFILLPALILTKVIYENVTFIIRAHPVDFKLLSFFILGMLILIPLMQNYLYIQNVFIERLAEKSAAIKSIKDALDGLNTLLEDQYSKIIVAKNALEVLLVVFVVSVIPALCEETMFRGFIQRSFEFTMTPFKAALLTAIFFALNHFNPYGLLPLIALGLFFGYAAYKSNSIVVPMVLHFMNNFIAVVMYLAFGSEELVDTKTMTNAELGFASLSFIVLLTLFGLVVYLIRRYNSNKLII
ncbi:MAG TPA: CPBP family intramembrane glutamic endopeptidase [Ignavibacteriaceae bacterium]|nr:CPBP family intramembrane glutamic endopeptidase [Ignavibacteriaceae bacterium]